MLLPPFSSPSPDHSPVTTSPPPLTVPQPPLASAPVASPPPPPPVNLISPALPPLAASPPLSSSLPEPPPLVVSPPPAATAISPIASAASPPSPIPPSVSYPPPTPMQSSLTYPPPLGIPSAPESPDQPPQAFAFQPSPPPLDSILPPPTVTLPPSETTPWAPSPTLPLPPILPVDSLPFAVVSPPSPPLFPSTPGSQATTPPPPPSSLPLAVGKGGFRSEESHAPIGLIVGCLTGGILLFFVLLFLQIRCRRRKRNQKPVEDYYKQSNLWPKGNSNAALSQLSKEKAAPPGFNVITIPKNFPPPPATNYDEAYGSNNSGPVNSVTLPAANAAPRGSFTYEELVAATNGFSELNLLGQGGFGYVHKGVLPCGKEVAVKKLKEGSHQGEREFQTEVETISRVHHKHLVSLVGYCIKRAERLLVYEFVPNRTLEFHLHGNEQPALDWPSRVKIAVGSAKGIAYLHEDCTPTIIHRDIKAANILLDSKFEAKVSDFGLAKFFSKANTPVTHISTRVVGTFGYLAPEYASTGKLTDKSDVYSYGVMLLELITGRPPITIKEFMMNESLVEWARPLLSQALQHDNFGALADPKLQGAYNMSEMRSMVACAAACVRHSSWLRPSMSQIIRALEGHASVAYIDEGMRSTYACSALIGEDYGVSGRSETSEYGLNPSCSSSEASQSVTKSWNM